HPTATTEHYTLSLHDALPIYRSDENATSSPDSRARLARRRWMEACASLFRHAGGRAGPRIAFGVGGAGAQRRRGDRWNRQLQKRSEEHTSELQSRRDLVCRLL